MGSSEPCQRAKLAARHRRQRGIMSDTQQQDRRYRHRYRQEFVSSASVLILMPGSKSVLPQ